MKLVPLIGSPPIPTQVETPRERFFSAYKISYVSVPDRETTPILPGETVTGFTIAAYVEDHSPKWYFYETVESGYAGETGFVAAVGLTQGPPVGVESATLSGVKALFD